MKPEELGVKGAVGSFVKVDLDRRMSTEEWAFEEEVQFIKKLIAENPLDSRGIIPIIAAGIIKGKNCTGNEQSHSY